MIGDTDKQTQFNKSVYSPLKEQEVLKKDLELF